MDKLKSMVLEAETVSALMIQMADDDVGDTSFGVMSDLGENGTEHECDLDVGETALRASAVITALLEELGTKDKRIAELERITEGVDQLAIDGGWTARGISEYAKSLEAKLSTPVRLPPLMDGELFGKNSATANAHNNAITACSIAILGAGFKSEATALKCEGDA